MLTKGVESELKIMKQTSQLTSKDLTELQQKIEKMANEFKVKKESG